MLFSVGAVGMGLAFRILSVRSIVGIGSVISYMLLVFVACCGGRGCSSRRRKIGDDDGFDEGEKHSDHDGRFQRFAEYLKVG
jgi:hypothetical protein